MTNLAGKLLTIPEKPRAVSEFESLSLKERDKIRGSSEWTEIAKHYDRYHEVIQLNVSEHLWRQKIGFEPRGLIEYVFGSFVDNKKYDDRGWVK